ncbi:hypothetical protein [uncultured Sphaerochaeta sp.]|uniref:hypothetical protein n=1 Tax=uncultured Sphaerochaeta sp. TaxID=886478 RepID=UPI002AA8A0C6|nr:hypothetical protein [uncultured Sphaerochaeta sp.]
MKRLFLKACLVLFLSLMLVLLFLALLPGKSTGRGAPFLDILTSAAKWGGCLCG